MGTCVPFAARARAWLSPRWADAALPWWAFALKALLTLCTFAGGFKGGEIMPVLATGACLGSTVGAGAVGAAAFFAACTKCPLTAAIMAVELFGIAPGRPLPSRHSRSLPVLASREPVPHDARSVGRIARGAQRCIGMRDRVFSEHVPAAVFPGYAEHRIAFMSQ